MSYIERKKGVQRQWYLNGNKQAEVNFKDGKLHGDYITFSEDGTITETFVYENGTRVK